MKKKVAWIIAGLDTSGGAGIVNDSNALVHFDVHPCIILSCIASQNNTHVINIFQTPMKVIEDQIYALRKNFYPQAIKIGLLQGSNLVQRIGRILEIFNVPVIADPIINTSSGYEILNKNELGVYVKFLFPQVTILTPNLFEVESLLGITIKNELDIEKSAMKLIDMGVKQVIVKGGHSSGNFAADYWTNGKEGCWLSLPRIMNKNVRGTGCAFSSALTACLAQEEPLLQAFYKAKNYVHQGIENAHLVNGNHYMFSHQQLSKNQLPNYRTKRYHLLCVPFVAAENMGFYPIISDIKMLSYLLNFKIRNVQIRLKGILEKKIEDTIKIACELGRKFGVNIWINDHWKLAIKMGAYGVHLGQEDLLTANLRDIQHAGLRLGISTHTESELMVAHSVVPSYIAIGPIFPTMTKPELKPLLTDKILLWRKLTDRPLIAIGGITLKNVTTLLDNDIDGVAVISALTNSNLSRDLREWLKIDTAMCG